MNQQELTHYFREVWSTLPISNIDRVIYSGLQLASRINANEQVIDIGCGRNHFKKLIPNLIGIDPAFDEADHRLTLEEFARVNREQFNVAFCLGSINFGSRETIENQIGLVKNLLLPKGRIYWRCNPGVQDHGAVETELIDFYPWSFEEHIRLADVFGFKIVELRWDQTNRIYAEWRLR